MFTLFGDVFVGKGVTTNAKFLLEHKFPITKPIHYATIRERARNSGLTSVRFVDTNKLVCCDFNENMLYLAELIGDELHIIHQTSTVIEGLIPVETDLLDVKQDLIATTNFYQGSVSLYKIENDIVTFQKEIFRNRRKGLHGVRFIPGYDDLMWLSYCNSKEKVAEIVNYKTEQLLHRIELGQQVQDVAFLDNYAICFARTKHISGGNVGHKIWRRPKKWIMYATAYLFEMPNDLNSSPPVLVSQWRGKGHIDATKEFADKVLVANQYNECVDIFKIDNRKIVHTGSIKGFSFPHGLDINEDGIVAVTNYGDSSLRLFRLTSEN